jgi:hypothetical protein
MKTLTLIAAFLALTATGIAQNGATQMELPVFGEFYNECCDEVVLVTGTAHVVFRGELFDGNHLHLDMKNAVGTGSNGGSYTQKGATTQNVEVKDNGSAVLTFQVKMVNDDGCSFSIRMVQKITINANGEMTAEVMKYDITCE